MRRLLLEARSALWWLLSVLHFVPGALAMLALSRIAGPRRTERALKPFCRNVVRLTGARFEVRPSPRFDPDRTCVFVSNHVNVFDPFTLCAAIPQPVRGFELESHFRVPVYGWLMRGFGNVPVPERRGRDGLDRMRQSAAASLASGTSLVLFPEGTRTRTGRVGPFRPGAFRFVVDLGVPVVPVTQVGAFELQHPGRRRLEPATVVVHLHDPIETAGLTDAERDALLERVRGIVAEPVEAAGGMPPAEDATGDLRP